MIMIMIMILRLRREGCATDDDSDLREDNGRNVLAACAAFCNPVLRRLARHPYRHGRGRFRCLRPLGTWPGSLRRGCGESDRPTCPNAARRSAIISDFPSACERRITYKSQAGLALQSSRGKERCSK